MRGLKTTKTFEMKWSVKMEFEDGEEEALRAIMPKSFADAEKFLISQAIGECDGNMSAVARIVGVTRSTLYSKMKLYGIGELIGQR